jgi:hypothetical protein
MFGSQLRTYGRNAVVSVILGAGIGFGRHYFVDSVGARIAGLGGNSPRSTMHPILHHRTLLSRERVQFWISSGFQTHPTPDDQPDATHAKCGEGYACRKYQPRG